MHFFVVVDSLSAHRELLQSMSFNSPWVWQGATSRHIDAAASVAAGLTYRSLAETVGDTHEWWQSQPDERRANARGWPTAEQERAVLERLGA